MVFRPAAGLLLLLLLSYHSSNGFLPQQQRRVRVFRPVRSSSSSSSDSTDDLLVADLSRGVSGKNASAYERYWSGLLQLELNKAMSDVQARLRTWSRQRLEDEGLAVFRLVAQPDGELFGEKLVLLVPADRNFAASEAAAAAAATQEVLAGNKNNARGADSSSTSSTSSSTNSSSNSNTGSDNSSSGWDTSAASSSSSSGGGGGKDAKESVGYAGGIFRRFSPGDVVSLSSSGPRQPRVPLTLAISGGNSLGSGNEGIVSEALVVLRSR